MAKLIVLGIALIFILIWYRKFAKSRRKRFIDSYAFPASIREKIRQKYPHLSHQQTEEVVCGLREYFQICNLGGRRFISMPSQVVDVAWHELILFTKAYELFCRKAFGRFLHHTPAEAMQSTTAAQSGIKRAWRFSCLREGINPRAPMRLPLLFAIDAELNIADGFCYSLNCKTPGSYPYCAGDIGCGGGCVGGSDGGSDADGSCGGGCGGD